MTIREGIIQFVADNPQYRIFHEYSGKFMFGRRCIGAVVREGDSFMDFMVRLTQFLDENDVDCENSDLEGASYDSLGLDTIVYFPNIEG